MLYMLSRQTNPPGNSECAEFGAVSVLPNHQVLFFRADGLTSASQVTERLLPRTEIFK